MKAYLYKYVSPACAVLFACACNQEDSTELAPAVLAMQNAGGVTNVELYDSGTTVSTTVEFRVVAESVSANTLNITFKSDATKVEEYNTANGTDYQMAPSECFDLTEAEVMLPRYNTVSSTAGVTISTSGISESVDYLLPVVIDKIEGDDNASVSDENNVIYVTIKKYVIQDESETLDRSDWEVIYCSSEGTESTYNGYPYGPAKYIFDDEINTWWNYNTSDSAPFYIVIDLKKELYIKSIILTARPDTGDNSFKTRGAPRNVDFAFATTINGNDEAAMEGDYSEYEVFTDLEQFRSRLNFRGEITLSGLYHCRYIKMRVNDAWRNSDSGAPDYISVDTSYPVAMVAEFEAAGYVNSPNE